MNAINPVPSSSAASGAEPSMEEILASIRRIIADDQSLPADQEVPSHHPSNPESSSRSLSVHEQPPEVAGDLPGDGLTADEPDAFEPPPAAGDGPRGHGIVEAPQFVSPEGPHAATPHPLAPQAPAAPEPELLAPDSQEPDLHEAALRAMHDDEPHPHPLDLESPMNAPDDPALFSAATSQSLAAAFNTLAVSRLADDSAELRGLAREMLRPMLKEWLDAHLPGMVEGIIRDEIERMSHRPR